MTQNTWQHFPIQKYQNKFIGFDDLFKSLENQIDKQSDKYPPHNLIKTSESEYVLSLPAIGRDANDFELEYNSGTLTISCKKLEIPDNHEMLYNNLSLRGFKKTFNLYEYLVIKSAKIEKGILNIYMEYIVPEDKKTKTIKVEQ